MKRLLHPIGIHLLKLVDVKFSKNSILKANCIFEGVGSHKSCQTLFRNISKHSPWGISSKPFLDQLEGFNNEEDLVKEISRFIGQEFLCQITEGNGRQRNITSFPSVSSHINSETHVSDGYLTAKSQVPHV